MDKNKCPKKYFKNTLTDKKICLDKKISSSQFKRENKYFMMIKFCKKLKDIFFRKYNGNRGNYFYAKKRQILLWIM